MEIIRSKNPKEDRRILENKKADVLLDPEVINHVMARIATKNKIAIGFDIQKLSKLSKEKKAIRISQIIPILKTCRKAKTKIKLINYKDKKDASALLLSLGASSQETAKAF